MQTELDKVVVALKEFYAAEAYLLERDLGERTLTHRLAVYVEKQFPGWQVDCNYDRLGERMLRMPHGTRGLRGRAARTRPRANSTAGRLQDCRNRPG
jgi:hypothetical protein